MPITAEIKPFRTKQVYQNFPWDDLFELFPDFDFDDDEDLFHDASQDVKSSS